MKKYLQLNDLDCYSHSFKLSNYVWTLIIAWDNFATNTIGIQFARAIDSISANIAEGFGRFGKKDKIKFYYYSYGSLKESQDWSEKAKIRNLLSIEQYNVIYTELSTLPIEIHRLILFTNNKLKQ